MTTGFPILGAEIIRSAKARPVFASTKRPAHRAKRPPMDRGARAGHLLPVRVLADVFRGKFLAALRREHARGSFAHFCAFEDREGFERLCAAITKHRWVLYAKKPFAGAERVFRYLGRYTHRVGTANSRILDVGVNHITFRISEGGALPSERWRPRPRLSSARA